MSGPHFKFSRSALGFNAIPTTSTGWVLTIVPTVIFTVLIIILVAILTVQIISMIAFAVAIIIVSAIYCWGLIFLVFRYGTEIDDR